MGFVENINKLASDITPQFINNINSVAGVTEMVVNVDTLQSGENAYALWNPSTTTLTLGVPSGEGPQGIQGIQGVKGDKGDKGDTGAQGIQGLTGDTGAKGDKGDTGLQGIQGIAGYTPIKGVDYFDGAKGDTGAQGIQGVAGTNGIDGKSITSVTSTKTGKDTTVTVDGTFTGAPYVFHILDGIDGTGSGDMAVATYDTNADGKVNAADTADSVPWAGITGKPTFATVATSGSYTDLSNKPTIPTVPTTISSFTNDSGYLSSVAWNIITGVPSTFTPSAHTHTVANITDFPASLPASDVYAWAKSATKPSYAYSEISDTPTIPTVPTNVSAFTNDSGYITSAYHDSTKSDTTHNHSGVYEPADATILKSASIGVTVQGYNANTTTQGNTFNGANQLVKLDSLGKLPAIDGSALTNLPSGASTLDGLTDVTITTPSSGQVLKYNGSAWINDTDATGGGSSTLTIQNKTSSYTVVAGDLGTIINCTSGTFTVSLTAATTLGAGFNCWVWNTSNTITDIITIDPNAGETIGGLATRVLYRNQGVQIVSDGTNWKLGAMQKDMSFASNSSSALPAPIASGSQSVAISTESVASAQSCLATQGGTASANYDTAIGRNSGGSASQAVTGAGAMALGGSYASGTDSFATAIANNTSSYGAIGANGIAIGYLSKASSSPSFAFGYRALASNNGAVALGGLNTGNTASGYLSCIVGGDGAVASTYGKEAFACREFATAGDAQRATYIIRRATTDATPSTLGALGDAAGANNQVILPNNSAYTFTGTVISKQSGSTNVASWKVEGVIVRGANAASTTLVASTVTAISNVPAWTLALSADTTNGGLSVIFTGAVATNIRTVATIETTEVIYA